jgi:hypothetical protein
MPFPPGSIRQGVALFGDNWALYTRRPTRDGLVVPNLVIAAEVEDADVMRRCATSGGWQLDRGTVWDPRVWIGVPLTERQE